MRWGSRDAPPAGMKIQLDERQAMLSKCADARARIHHSRFIDLRLE